MHASLQYLNDCPTDQFSFLLGSVFQHSPWVAQAVADQRPFESRIDLLSSMCAVVKNLDEEQKLALIRDHHESSRWIADMMERDAESVDSESETQDADEVEMIDNVSHAYWMKFGFPFVIGSQHTPRTQLIEHMRSRLENPREEEISHALKQIYHLAKSRLERVVTEEG